MRNQPRKCIFIFLLSIIFVLVSLLLMNQFTGCSKTHSSSTVFPSKMDPYILATLSRQADKMYTSLKHRNLADLRNNGPPFIVHYLWCRKGHFEFKHYLSLLSIVNKLRPDWINFYYSHLPERDTKGYVTWFDDIQRDIPFLKLQHVPHSQYCSHSFFQDDFVLVDGLKRSGFYISDEVIVLNFTYSQYLSLAQSHSSNQDKMFVFFFPDSEPHMVSKSTHFRAVFCPSLKEYNLVVKTNYTACAHLTQRLSPPDIWHQKAPFYATARSLMYNSSEPIRPAADTTTLVPQTCHILYLRGISDLDLTAYASVLSAIQVGKMQRVIVHSVSTLLGPRWNKLVSNYNVSSIPVLNLDRWHPTMGGILYGINVLLFHGGVVINSDTIWQKELSVDLRSYNSIATLRRSVYRIINYAIDLNALVSKPESDFLKQLLATLRQTPYRHGNANSEEVAYRVYLDTPSSVQIERNLVQHMVCKNGKCEPSKEDAGAGHSVFRQMEWKNNVPETESDLEQFHGPGIKEVKDMLDKLHL